MRVKAYQVDELTSLAEEAADPLFHANSGYDSPSCEPSDTRTASVAVRRLGELFDRVRAAEHNRSMEEEVRIILREAVSDGKPGPRDLAKFTRDCFAPLGGVELDLPPRGPMREPPDFD